MPLAHIEVHQFRNFKAVRLPLDSGIQLVYGDNACGKTSLLEAMHTLCSGKSFLGASPRKMQQFEKTAFSIHGIVRQTGHPAQKLQYRWEEGQIRLSVDSESMRKTSEYAVLQPAQAITPTSHKIIDDRPEIRRKFLDWGVFHVKPEYAAIWQQFQRSLGQRNALLHAGPDKRTLTAWSHEYIHLAETLDQYRKAYLDQLLIELQRVSEQLLGKETLCLGYSPGWDRERGLQQLLEENHARDLERKFTYYGPQRAELSIVLQGHSARDTASRGQKKLITFALYLAQASLQQVMGHKQGLLLIDDLPSELDLEHQAVVLGVIQDLAMQTVISCINPQHLPTAGKELSKQFHVKHGQVIEVL